MRYASYRETYDASAEDPKQVHQYHFQSIVCPVKGPNCTPTEEITVNGEDLFKYQSNQVRFIQDAFPYLTANQRERLMSGICNNCFDDMTKEED
jgi:hypothetical protein